MAKDDDGVSVEASSRKPHAYTLHYDGGYLVLPNADVARKAVMALVVAVAATEGKLAENAGMVLFPMFVLDAFGKRR